MGGGSRLLHGVRILDFTWAAAGPYATLLLGFLGADVVKVESLRRLDPARRGFLMQSYDGVDLSPVFNELNLNKRSLQIDLTQKESVGIIREIAGQFDVVVDNFRPGVMARLGFGADLLLADHPHLVVASSSANGATGPEAMGAGLASIFAASGGLSTQSGYPDGPPTEVSDTMDYRSGTALAVAIAAALLHRRRTGRGQRIDLSSREVVLASAPDSLLAAALGVEWAPRVGNGHRLMIPHGLFACSDGSWLAVAVDGPGEWSGLCAALGEPEWERRYPDADRRREVEGMIIDAVARWAAYLQCHGVAAAPVMTFEAIAGDPHLEARQTLVEVHHPALGRQRVMRAPWRLEGYEPGTVRAGPCLGADNDILLAGCRAATSVPPERREEVFR
jgi:benzylsuccinate CoA-transferase BbsF subunit